MNFFLSQNTHGILCRHTLSVAIRSADKYYLFLYIPISYQYVEAQCTLRRRLLFAWADCALQNIRERMFPRNWKYRGWCNMLVKNSLNRPLNHTERVHCVAKQSNFISSHFNTNFGQHFELGAGDAK